MLKWALQGIWYFHDLRFSEYRFHMGIARLFSGQFFIVLCSVLSFENACVKSGNAIL